MGRREALLSAGRTRLRPIIMTTVAMIFGMLPLALALGEGAEQRAPMAAPASAGWITSTLLTLFVVPVVYTLLDDFTNRLFRRGPAKPAHRARVQASRPKRRTDLGREAREARSAGCKTKRGSQGGLR
jgi:HAE1 family hydrophobic/amphiphilic exporter-1